jgi:hypothetical protein
MNFQEKVASLKDGKSMTFEGQNSPTDESLGNYHTVTLADTIYIDSSDFRLKDTSPSYYGLAPNKAGGLKCYGGNLICDEVVEENVKIVDLKCHLHSFVFNCRRRRGKPER